MAFSTTQKKWMGGSLLAIIGVLAFVGFKVYGSKTFKVFQDIDGYLELGIEDGTKECSHCEREFYLRLYKYFPFNETSKSSSVIISNSLYKDLIKIELFDEGSKTKLSIPYKIQYKSGTRWYDYPPKSVDLSLSTQPKFFKVIADIPKNTAVSGLVGIKIILAGKTVAIKEDPIWWINGVPYNVSNLCSYSIKTTIETIEEFNNNITQSFTCPTNFFNFTPSKKIATCYNRITNANSSFTYKLKFTHNYDYGYVSNKTIYWIVTSPSSYNNLINSTVCNKEGFIINGKIINFTTCGIKCTWDSPCVQCDLCNGDSNCNGYLESGESGNKVCIDQEGWKKNLLQWRVDSGNIDMKSHLKECLQ